MFVSFFQLTCVCCVWVQVLRSYPSPVSATPNMAATVEDSPARASAAANASAVRNRARSDEDVLRDSLRSVSFIDLAGNEKYLKTTVRGLIGWAPQYCLVTVSAARCDNAY